MSSETVTRNDLTAILNEVLPPTPSEYRKLLWTNPSPSSSFAAQTVSLDLSNYDEVEIEFLHANASDSYLCQKARIGSTDVGLFYTSVKNGIPIEVEGRQITVSNTGIVFSDGARAYNSFTASTDNIRCVPIRIYGIKYERVAPPQLEDLTIIEDLGVYNIPSTGTWTFPNVKPYKRMFICFPIWGAYNSSTLASTPIFADANQSSTTITNWTNRAGGIVTNTTVSAYVLAIRMEF